MSDLPRWKCHKEVSASKIKEIASETGGAVLHLQEGGPVTVNLLWLDRHRPKAGGYYVLYNDGYASFSPAEAFEEGYTRI